MLIKKLYLLDAHFEYLTNYTFTTNRTKYHEIVHLFNEQFGYFLAISLGVFLFVLFFQPFPLDAFDFNNRLIFIAGLGSIVFVSMVLVRVLLPCLLHQGTKVSKFLFAPFVSSFIILACCAVAFAFYLRFVGIVEISFYIMFKVVFICLAVPVIIRTLDVMKALRKNIVILNEANEKLEALVEEKGITMMNKSIEFPSDNSNEVLVLVAKEVLFIRSADNYVEIFYLENDSVKKKLLRNTLKNIELLLGSYPMFVRCHRTVIVNSTLIDNFNKTINNSWLTLKGFEEQIPVSRQYLSKFKS